MGVVRKIWLNTSPRSLVAELNGEARFISSIPTVGDRVGHVVFAQVEKDACVDSFTSFQRRILNMLGIDRGLVFATAADVGRYIDVSVKLDRDIDLEIEIIATVGLEPPACVDLEKLYRPIAGTINIATILDSEVPQSALADLFKTVVEAKVSASSYLMLRCRSRSVGTVSDAIAVGFLESGKRRNILTMGMATSVGGVVARKIHGVLIDHAVNKMGIEGFVRNCIGMDIDDLASLAYRFASELSIDAPTKDYFRIAIAEVLGDPNVLMALIASRELDLYRRSGVIDKIARVQGSPQSYSGLDLAFLLGRSVIERGRCIKIDDCIDLYRRLLHLSSETGEEHHGGTVFEWYMVVSLITRILCCMNQNRR